MLALCGWIVLAAVVFLTVLLVLEKRALNEDPVRRDKREAKRRRLADAEVLPAREQEGGARSRLPASPTTRVRLTEPAA
jgi:hypothetical protein